MVVHGPLKKEKLPACLKRKVFKIDLEMSRSTSALWSFRKNKHTSALWELRLPKVRQLENLRRLLLSWKLNPCARTTDVALLYETTCSSDNRTLIWHEANPSSVKNMQAHRTVFKGNNKGIHSAIPCFLRSAVSFHPVVPQSSQLLLAVYAAHSRNWSWRVVPSAVQCDDKLHKAKRSRSLWFRQWNIRSHWFSKIVLENQQMPQYHWLDSVVWLTSMEFLVNVVSRQLAQGFLFALFEFI